MGDNERPASQQPSGDMDTINTHVYTNLDLIPRFNGPTLEDLTAEQRDLRNVVLAHRPHGLTGPFGPWLSTPAILRPAEELGRVCRFGTSLARHESELLMLLTAVKARCGTVTDVHVGEALRAGLKMEVISAIPRNDEFSLAAVKERVLPLLNNGREKAIASFAAELLDTSTVGDETYSTTKAAVGGNDSVLVEITTIVGYYVLGSFILNAFRMPSKR